MAEALKGVFASTGSDITTVVVIGCHTLTGAGSGSSMEVIRTSGGESMKNLSARSADICVRVRREFQDSRLLHVLICCICKSGGVQRCSRTV